MASICDDLRRLDRVLLHLAHGSGGTFRTHFLLSLARRRVQILEKKARFLDSLYVAKEGKSSGSGGATPLLMQDSDCFLAENFFQKNFNSIDHKQSLRNQGASHKTYCSCLPQEQMHDAGAYYVQ